MLSRINRWPSLALLIISGFAATQTVPVYAAETSSVEVAEAEAPAASPAAAVSATDETSESTITEPVVQLYSFEIHPFILPGRVLLRWSTEVEQNNAGFNVYRAVPDGKGSVNQGEKLNETLIPATSEGQFGGDYEFVDSEPSSTMALDRQYYLESVAINGVQTTHGPIAFPGVVFGETSVEDWSSY